MLVVGVVLFALGILVSLLIHEIGHAATARMFGIKVTRFFIGMGPTLVSFRRGGTEYGVKAVPVGAFVGLAGMTHHDNVDPTDKHRAMYTYPLWKRTVVMMAGSAGHFLFGIVLLWGLFAFVPFPDAGRTASSPTIIDTVAPCISVDWAIDPATGQPKACQPGVDPASPAASLGLRHGDQIVAVNGQTVPTFQSMSEKVRAAGGQTIALTYQRDGRTVTSSVRVPLAQRPRLDLDPNTPVSSVTAADLEPVGQLGISPIPATVSAGPVGAFGLAKTQAAGMVGETFGAIGRFPEKIPKLWAALAGHERDPQTPVSLVGASVIGGQLFGHSDYADFLALLAGLNFFIGVFNLVPLLPMDGGHIAVWWFERGRSALYRRFGRRDPGRVDYFKLMPVTLIVIVVFGAITLLNVAVDIINPIRIS